MTSLLSYIYRIVACTKVSNNNFEKKCFTCLKSEITYFLENTGDKNLSAANSILSGYCCHPSCEQGALNIISLAADPFTWCP